jgi:hypothetical protein
MPVYLPQSLHRRITVGTPWPYLDLLASKLLVPLCIVLGYSTANVDYVPMHNPYNDYSTHLSGCYPCETHFDPSLFYSHSTS